MSLGINSNFVNPFQKINDLNIANEKEQNSNNDLIQMQLDIEDDSFENSSANMFNDANVLNADKEVQNKPLRALDIYSLLSHANISTENITLNENKMNPYFMADMKKLQYAEENGIDIKDVIVPKFDTKEKAISETKPGDVFKLKDSNFISIKLADGSVKDLKLSEDKYMELFPPGQKFATKQGYLNDCFLVSSVDAMMKSPNGFAQILSCFEEFENGDVAVKFPNGKSSYMLKNGANIEDDIKAATDMSFFGKTYEVKDDKEYSLKGCTGLKMIEHLYGVEVHQKDVNNMFLDSDLMTELNKSSDERDDAKLAELHFKYEQALTNEADITSAIASGGDSFTFVSCFENVDISSGNITNEKILDALTNKDNIGKVCITADHLGVLSPDYKNEHNLIASHGYIITPFESDDGSIQYQVYNPHNTAIVEILNYEDVTGFFNDFTCVKYP